MVATMALTAPSRSNSAKVQTHPEHYYRIYDRILASKYLQLQNRRRALLLDPAARKYLPRMDLYDDETQPRISAMLEIPGVDRERIIVHVQDDTLIVQGTRSSSFATLLGSNPGSSLTEPSREMNPHVNDNQDSLIDSSSPQKYKVRELKFGTFRREIRLPAGTKSTDIAADLRDGMLLLSWPRTPASTSTRLSVPGTSSQTSYITTSA